MSAHPDQQFATLILKGLERGFRIVFLKYNVKLEQNKRNLLSAMDHPEVVTSYIQKELGQCRIAYLALRLTQI